MPKLNISERLMEVVFSAVQEGMGTLKAEQDLIPFVLLLTKEGVTLQRFSDEDTTIAIERAQASIQEADDEALAYVLVFDSQIEVDGKDSDALMIESGERGKAKGWRFIQRYQAQAGTTPVSPIGELAYLGSARTYFD